MGELGASLGFESPGLAGKSMEDGAVSYALDIVELWDILLLDSNYDMIC
jgi:hypothetical protein